MIINPYDLFKERNLKEWISNQEEKQFMEELYEAYMKAKADNFQSVRVEWGNLPIRFISYILLDDVSIGLPYGETNQIQERVEIIIAENWDKYINSFYYTGHFIENLLGYEKDLNGQVEMARYENALFVEANCRNLIRSKETGIKYYPIARTRLIPEGIERVKRPIDFLITLNDLIEIIHEANESVGLGYSTSDEDIEL